MEVDDELEEEVVEDEEVVELVVVEVVVVVVPPATKTPVAQVLEVSVSERGLDAKSWHVTEQMCQ